MIQFIKGLVMAKKKKNKSTEKNERKQSSVTVEELIADNWMHLKYKDGYDVYAKDGKRTKVKKD